MSFHNAFKNRKVLVTGHTGFKGSWLSLWLQLLGANVIGYSLAPSTEPNNFTLIGLDKEITHIIGDIRDFSNLEKIIRSYEPEVVFHLAAQPIVLHGFKYPKETFDTNAGGTVNLLEAIRKSPSVKAVVVATTDKCYENREWTWGYRENDPLGGNDPYSCSKSMAEFAINSYRHSFLNELGIAIASARAGNVIGGGDFSPFRLIPDCMRALTASKPVSVRNPNSIRPWLHVLDPLSGYLELAAKLLNDGPTFAEAWNFGPLEQQPVTTQLLVEKAIQLWGTGEWINHQTGTSPEMQTLWLNWDKTAHRLQWRPKYDWESAVASTVSWFKKYKENPQDMRSFCLKQIENHMG